MSEEQVENTQEELTTEELYDKGFEEGIVDAVDNEEETEELEQPEEETETETDTQPDEEEQETADVEESEDSKDLVELDYKGQKLKVTIEEAKILAQKGFDYTSKTQDLSNKRRLIELASENEVDEELIVTLGEAKKGNKEAFATLANKFGIDPYDLDTESNYKPVIEDRNYALDDVIDTIKSDKENGQVVDGWIQALPRAVTNSFADNPDLLRGLHIDATKGVAQKIMPEVIKQMAINPSVDFVQAYQEVGKKVMEAKESKPEASREQRKKVSVSKKKVSKHDSDHRDVWEDDELYQKMKRMVKQ